MGKGRAFPQPMYQVVDPLERRSVRIAVLLQDRLSLGIAQIGLQHPEPAEVDQGSAVPILQRQSCDAFAEQAAVEGP